MAIITIKFLVHDADFDRFDEETKKCATDKEKKEGFDGLAILQDVVEDHLGLNGVPVLAIHSRREAN